jgi:hypothetical protein
MAVDEIMNCQMRKAFDTFASCAARQTPSVSDREDSYDSRNAHE